MQLPKCDPHALANVGSNQIRVVPDGLSVTILNARDEAEATPWAEEYCKKSGRRPQFRQIMPYKTPRSRSTGAVFDCV
jgi:hypothetical protein